MNSVWAMQVDVLSSGSDLVCVKVNVVPALN
jgi:hypothetical protein